VWARNAPALSRSRKSTAALGQRRRAPHDAVEERLAATALDGLAHERCRRRVRPSIHAYHCRGAQRAALAAQTGSARADWSGLECAPERGDAFDELLQIFDREGAERCGGAFTAFPATCRSRTSVWRAARHRLGIPTQERASCARCAAALWSDFGRTDTPAAPAPHRGCATSRPGRARETLAEPTAARRDEIAALTSARAVFRIGLRS
jgi:hypothetical protein